MDLQDIETALVLQNKINISANGEFWATNRLNENTGKLINWRRVAWLGVAEIIESSDWNHSHHNLNDLVKINHKLTDIWHALLSATLSEHTKCDMNIIKHYIVDAANKTYLPSDDEIEISEALVVRLLDKSKALHIDDDIDDYCAYVLFFNLCNKFKLGLDDLHKSFDLCITDIV